ncbi:sigma-54-dependent transcriptional regulator [Anaeromyxobacter oryzisoli]|uniref:sigma-54-dependent transcriptional regulator n=1 Tax=Anaeromyxobacter oryzisoli TaxID=2925408 RepID=UPI001F5A7192|nr:sigma-54 dependent transcriptional regulator [Anaeromyxobacter sp. SG63]
MARILLVDDDAAVRAALAELTRSQGHEAVLAASGAEALAALEGADVVVTDLAMPGMDGLELLRAVHERDEALPVVLLTAHGSERIAVRAMKAGAYEYVSKPFDVDEMALVLDRAAEARALRTQSRRLRAEQAIGRRIVGTSAPMRRLLDAVARVAGKDVTVLVRGETGVGKELVGSLLHAESRRATGPLVRFNCAAIPPELAEAELFGHARGAFTGAVQARPGFFAQADGGTLVLDEIGELPLGVQAALLRALQDGEIQPVGAARLEKVDVRIVACTNRELEAEVRAGRFRADLYYRLAVVELVVPPLRDRREDIPELAAELLRHYAERFGVPDVRLSPALVARLVAADWPGNVRQLENTVARLVALSSGGEIGPEALEPAPGASAAPSAAAAPTGGAEADADAEGPATREPGRPLTLREQLEAVERSIVARAMTDARGNQSEAARRLGVSRGTLIDRLKRFGLAPDYGGRR